MSTFRYVGIWSGGANYSNGEWSLNAEGFRSIEHARQVLAHRRSRSLRMPDALAPAIVEWDDDGKPRATDVLSDDLTPGVDETSTIILARWDTDLRTLESDGHYACDYQVEFGPRGGVVVIAL